jgi:hypothetical protein|tara:strand:+ start:100 stop:573 length:474 start_codon:yes stop_codon:yes gene_type:complete
MATIDRTPNGGTAGHPANVARPYVMTSQVHDTADGGAGGDVIQLIDVPADTMIVSGVLEVLEARSNSSVTLDIGFTGGDVDCFIDGSTLAAGFTPFLEAAAGASGSNARVLTSADTIDALIIDSGSTGESAARFRIHVVLVDISKNPVESATVSTGT